MMDFNPEHLNALIESIPQPYRGYLAMAVGLVGVASVIVKFLEWATRLLVVFFPKLKGVDGTLAGVAKVLDAIRKSRWLNIPALTPKPEDPKPSLAAQVAGPAAALKSEPYKGPFTGG